MAKKKVKGYAFSALLALVAMLLFCLSTCEGGAFTLGEDEPGTQITQGTGDGPGVSGDGSEEIDGKEPETKPEP